MGTTYLDEVVRLASLGRLNRELPMLRSSSVFCLPLKPSCVASIPCMEANQRPQQLTVVLWVLCIVGVYVFVENNRRVLKGVASYFIHVPDFLPSGGGWSSHRCWKAKVIEPAQFPDFYLSSYHRLRELLPSAEFPVCCLQILRLPSLISLKFMFSSTHPTLTPLAVRTTQSSYIHTDTSLLPPSYPSLDRPRPPYHPSSCNPAARPRPPAPA